MMLLEVLKAFKNLDSLKSKIFVHFVATRGCKTTILFWYVLFGKMMRVKGVKEKVFENKQLVSHAFLSKEFAGPNGKDLEIKKYRNKR